MPRPRIFVSSTYYDLKHVRASLEVFIESLGFEPILFERGDIAFSPDQALDESCYREAQNADIFVLIIGGRYGSAASSDTQSGVVAVDYNSITSKEFDSAQSAGVPTFILIESSVHSEYETFKKNRNHADVAYAHVDNVKVYLLLDRIFGKSRNNVVFPFERVTDIEAWLRTQWSALFRDLLRSESQRQQLSNLNAQIEVMQTINQTFKTYLEELVRKASPEKSDNLIAEETHKVDDAIQKLLHTNTWYSWLLRNTGSSEISTQIIVEPSTAEEAIRLFEQKFTDQSQKEVLRKRNAAQADHNRARAILNLPPLDFSAYPDDGKPASTPKPK